MIQFFRQSLLLVGLSLSLGASVAWAQDVPPSPRVMWGLGFSGLYESAPGVIVPGFNLLVDVTPREINYSLQGAVTVSTFAGGSEAVIDLLLEKTFRLKNGLDIELGLGPSLVKAQNDINTSTTVGILTAATCNYAFASYWGVFVEPTLQLLPRNGMELSVGATLGLSYRR